MATPKGALRAFRISNGFTPSEMAKKLGIAESTLRSYENGHREIDGDFAVHIEAVLGLDRMLIRPDLFRRREARAAA